jgi:hypothetical protein
VARSNDQRLMCVARINQSELVVVRAPYGSLYREGSCDLREASVYRGVEGVLTPLEVRHVGSNSQQQQLQTPRGVFTAQFQPQRQDFYWEPVYGGRCEQLRSLRADHFEPILGDSNGRLTVHSRARKVLYAGVGKATVVVTAVNGDWKSAELYLGAASATKLERQVVDDLEVTWQRTRLGVLGMDFSYEKNVGSWRGPLQPISVAKVTFDQVGGTAQIWQ